VPDPSEHGGKGQRDGGGGPGTGVSGLPGGEHGHRGRNILLAVGGTVAGGAVIGGGLVASGAFDSGSPDSGHVQITDATPGFTPPPGTVIAETPTAIRTPTEIPATSTPEKPKRTLEEQLGYSLAPDSIFKYQGPDVEIDFGVQKEVQTRTSCDLGPYGKIACSPFQRISLSGEGLKKYANVDMSDAELVRRLNDAVLEGHLVNLRKEEQYANWTLQDLKTRLQDIKAGKNVEHPKYPIASGFKEDEKFIQPIEIDASMPVYIHTITNPGKIAVITSQQSYNYRQVNNGSLVIEKWNPSGDGPNPKYPTAHMETWTFAYFIGTGFTAASYPVLQDGQQHDLSVTSALGVEFNRTAKPIYDLLIPVQDQQNQLQVGIFLGE
jgi:hypothetical protein